MARSSPGGEGRNPKLIAFSRMTTSTVPVRDSPSVAAIWARKSFAVELSRKDAR